MGELIEHNAVLEDKVRKLSELTVRKGEGCKRKINGMVCYCL